MSRFLLCLWGLVLILGLACGASEPAPEATPSPIETTPQFTTAQTVSAETNGDVSASNVLGRRLSSGVSIADIVEQALPSVVQVTTSNSTGTGFIIDPSGLGPVHTNATHRL